MPRSQLHGGKPNHNIARAVPLGYGEDGGPVTNEEVSHRRSHDRNSNHRHSASRGPIKLGLIGGFGTRVPRNARVARARFAATMQKQAGS